VWSSPSNFSNIIINHQTFNNKKFNTRLPIVKQSIIGFALYYTTTWLLTSIQLWPFLFYLLTYILFILVLPNAYPHISHLPRWTNIHISNLHFIFCMAILNPKKLDLKWRSWLGLNMGYLWYLKDNLRVQAL
jgi:hypothetical protein